MSLLEENPQVEEVEGREAVEFTGASASHVDFAYGEEQILKDYSMDVPKGKVIGIHGASGSGKSTFLKLLMRFWDRQKGDIFISGRDVREINTSNLRDMESYVTQETYLFHDSIANNIGVGKPGASREEIIEAPKRHRFMILFRHFQRDMIRKSASWVIHFPAVSVRESVLPELFFTMRRLSFWMNRPVIWMR